MAKPKVPKAGTQIDKFRDLARQLGADEDEEAFKAKLVKVAKAPRRPAKKND
jgi:hypothetical protein